MGHPWMVDLGTHFLKFLSFYSFCLHSSSWRMVALSGIAPCCIVMLTMAVLPETPYWLIENNQYEEAKKSLAFFRGPVYDITPEVEEIQEKHLTKHSESCSWIMKRLCSSAFFKPFSCIGLLKVLFNASGFDTLLIYMIPVLKEAKSSIDPKLGAIIVGGVRVLTAGKI